MINPYNKHGIDQRLTLLSTPSPINCVAKIIQGQGQSQVHGQGRLTVILAKIFWLAGRAKIQIWPGRKAIQTRAGPCVRRMAVYKWVSQSRARFSIREWQNVALAPTGSHLSRDDGLLVLLCFKQKSKARVHVCLLAFRFGWIVGYLVGRLAACWFVGLLVHC